MQKLLLLSCLSILIAINTSASMAATNSLSSTTKVPANIHSQSSVIEQLQNLRKTSQLDAAKALAHKHLQSNPNDVDVMLLLGLTFYQQKDYANARVYLQRVLIKAPNYLDARIGLIRTAIAQGEHKKAAVLINQGLKQSPNNLELKELNAQNFDALKQSDIRNNSTMQKMRERR